MTHNADPSYHEHLRDERNQMEGILNQRFNFFILTFGFVLAAIPYATNERQLKLVFILGSLIELVFTLLIRRAQRRLQISSELLDELGNDPTTEIKKRANSGHKLNPFRYSVVRLMGYGIPFLTTAILIISVFYSSFIFDFFK